MRTLGGFALSSAVLALGASLLAATPAHAADKDCSDFPSQRAAQIFFIKHGGPQLDPHRLDEEGDGIACESNPAPYYYGTRLPGGGHKPKPKPAVKRDRAIIVRVIDGDTVRVRFGGHRRTVRMLGLDTPEVYGGQECGGRQASRSAKKLMPRGTRVLLVSDPSQDNKDRYGRLLRYVERNGRDMSQGQIRRGWAKTYVYAHNPFRRVDAYRLAQRRAKTADVGIWDMCGGRNHRPL